MLEIKGSVQSLTDRRKWAARAASFVAKLKATKVVWFTPEPVEAGKKTAASAENATERAAKKAISAGKDTTSGTKKVNKGVRPKTT
jgi:hypothetical protein